MFGFLQQQQQQRRACHSTLSSGRNSGPVCVCVFFTTTIFTHHICRALEPFFTGDAFANVSRSVRCTGDVVPPLRVCQYASSTQTPCVLAFNTAHGSPVVSSPRVAASALCAYAMLGSCSANGVEEINTNPSPSQRSLWVTLATDPTVDAAVWTTLCYSRQQYHSIVRL